MIARETWLSCVQLNLILLVRWSASSSSHLVLPEVTSYAKVSRNGNRMTNVTAQGLNQGREFQDVTISRSPVYVAPNLRKGEAVDHPSAIKYSTLDREAVAKLEGSRKQAQDRFHPPASFQHTIAHANSMKKQPSSSATSSKVAFLVPSYATLPRDVYSPNYNYQTDSKPINDPPTPNTSDDYSSNSQDTFSKIPDSLAEIYQNDPGKDSTMYSGFPSSSSYGEKFPTNPVEFLNHYDDPTFDDDSYLSHHHGDHDFIYDRPPDDPPTTTTEEPEMNDQRLSKRPYSYYYIGKKLWYLPLYFSIYFIIYIAALVLKSITRHKINFPASLAAVAGDARHDKHWESPSWLGLTKKVLDGIDAYNAIGKTKYDPLTDI